MEEEKKLITFIRQEEKKEPEIIKFIHVRNEEKKEPIYVRFITEEEKKELERKALLQQAHGELLSWRNRYIKNDIVAKELQEVFAAIEQLEKSLNK